MISTKEFAGHRTGTRPRPLPSYRSPAARSATAPSRYRPGTLTEVLTEHHHRTHPEALDLVSR